VPRPPERLPEFESLFLDALLRALPRRRRSFRGVRVKRENVRSGDVPFEWLTLELKLPAACDLAVSVREDGFATVALRQHAKKLGWTFVVELTAELWPVGPADIVQRVEATAALAPLEVREATPADREAFKAIWSAPPRVPRKKRRR
jgi:hypothetical protein